MFTIALSISIILGYFFSKSIYQYNSNFQNKKSSKNKKRFFIFFGSLSFAVLILNLGNFVRDNDSIEVFELTLLFIYNFIVVATLLHLSAYDILYLTQNKIWIYRLLLFLIVFSVLVISLRVLTNLFFLESSSFSSLLVGNFHNIANFTIGFCIFRVLELVLRQKTFTLEDVLLISTFGLILNPIDYLLFCLGWILVGGIVAIIAIMYKKENYRTLIPISPLLLISYLVIFGYTDIIKEFLNI